jgi:hypothetical protein
MERKGRLDKYHRGSEYQETHKQIGIVIISGIRSYSLVNKIKSIKKTKS